MDLTYILILFLCYFVTDIESLMFHLPPNGKKCLKEEIHKDVLVTGEYTMSETPDVHTTTLTVRSENAEAENFQSMFYRF